MSNLQLMIDIETLGTCANALVTQIGAVYWDLQTGEVTVNSKGEDRFSVNISLASGFNHGLKVDAGAIKFWFEQPEAHRTWLKGGVELSEALTKFKQFYPDDKVPVWCHANFDLPILGDAYRAIGQKSPVSYRKSRDIRTIVALADLPYEKGAEKTHDALDDCLRQIKYVHRCYVALKGRKTGY